MKYNRKNLPNSRAKLEEFVRENGLHPYGVVSYQGRDIFLAETDLEMDDPITHPLGYWQAAWFVTAPDSMGAVGGFMTHSTIWIRAGLLKPREMRESKT